MSIVPNISTAFFSDCNTFATPANSTCAKVESLKEKKRLNSRPVYLSSLLDRTSCERSIELVDSLLSYFQKHSQGKSEFRLSEKIRNE